jgi:Fe-S-cluster-containing dehydrogenase component
MKKWNLVVDVAKCENCNNCALATKDEYLENAFPGYSAPMPRHGHDWLRIDRSVRGEGSMVDASYRPTMCNHCDDAPCVKAGKGAVRKRDDGIVIVDPDKAKGRRDLVDSCPYGMIWWNDELDLPQNWPFDAHLLDAGWKQTRGGHACPTGAMWATKADDEEMKKLVRDLGLMVLQPELGTRPRVYYRNLHLFDKCFIGGSVIADVNGVTECISGAEVELFKGKDSIGKMTTDTFGDFKFDGIEPESGEYAIKISRSGLGSASVAARLGKESFCAGEIRLA